MFTSVGDWYNLWLIETAVKIGAMIPTTIVSVIIRGSFLFFEQSESNPSIAFVKDAKRFH